MNTTIILYRAGKAMVKALVLISVLIMVALTLINTSHGEKINKAPVKFSLDKKPTLEWQIAVNVGVQVSRGIFDNYNANDTVPFAIVRKDSNNITRYRITGTFFKSNDIIYISLGDSIILNYKVWSVSPGNYISYTPLGISVAGFSLSKDTARIFVENLQTTAGQPIGITIKNADLSDLTGIISMDTLTASGLLNANIRLNGFGKTPTLFSATATVTNFQLKQQPAGNLQMNARLTKENTIHTTLDLTGLENDISAAGDIFLNKGLQQLDALLTIKKLQLALLPVFLKRQLSAASGYLNGLLTLKGKFRQPEWSGNMNFDSAKFTLNQFGTTYFINKQNVLLKYPAITFNHFEIKDSLNHSLILNGDVCSNSRKKYDVDINVTTSDFSVLNAQKAINNQLYGYAGTDAKLTITGNASKPLVSGNIRFNNKTELTMVLPEKNADKDAAGGVVRFIARDTFAFTEKEVNKRAAEPGLDIKKILNNKLNFQVDSQAMLTIVIDPSTGDELKVKGITKFNAGSRPGVPAVLAGMYRLDSGYYELNYQFSKKRFNLIRGSTIEFNGIPTDAKINITAEYIGNTEPKNLLGNEVGTIDPKIARSFNKAIPFRIILFLKGSLNKPVISFDIQLPEGSGITRQLKTTIENKLVQLRADVAATNKEVFALLVLGRFVGEQSTDFFKGNGADFSDINKESVSQFLSAALDRLASDLFKGINVDLNLNSYKEFTANDGSQKSDLNVDVSKNFLDDRLSVTVGKNFGIESQDASTKASQQKASRFLPDVTVNYKLSADGKYMIRAYNKNPFEVVMDGYIVETGLAFIITMDYEKYQELFKNDKTISR